MSDERRITFGSPMSTDDFPVYGNFVEAGRKALHQEMTFDVTFDADGTMTLEKKDKDKPDPYVLTFEGEYAGKVYSVTVDIMADSPIEAVIEEVFDLDEGEEILSVLVGKPDGSTEVRSCRNSRRS